MRYFEVLNYLILPFKCYSSFSLSTSIKNSMAMNYAHIGCLYKPCTMHMKGVYYNINNITIITLEIKNKCTMVITKRFSIYFVIVSLMIKRFYIFYFLNKLI